MPGFNPPSYVNVHTNLREFLLSILLFSILFVWLRRAIGCLIPSLLLYSNNVNFFNTHLYQVKVGLFHTVQQNLNSLNHFNLFELISWMTAILLVCGDIHKNPGPLFHVTLLLRLMTLYIFLTFLILVPYRLCIIICNFPLSKMIPWKVISILLVLSQLMKLGLHPLLK